MTKLKYSDYAYKYDSKYAEKTFAKVIKEVKEEEKLTQKKLDYFLKTRVRNEKMYK